MRGGRAWGFGRKEYTITGSHVGLQSELHLFAAEIPEPASPAQARRGRQAKTAQPPPIWSKTVDIHPRAMLLSGDTLYLAGCQKVCDFTAKQPQGNVALLAVSADTGETVASYRLLVAPTYDSLAMAEGKLYFTTVDGRVVCRGGKESGKPKAESGSGF